MDEITLLPEAPMVDNETVLSYADWIFPRYFGDTSWGRNPVFSCHDCLTFFGYALPTDKLRLSTRKKGQVLVCKTHSSV